MEYTQQEVEFFSPKNPIFHARVFSTFLKIPGQKQPSNRYSNGASRTFQNPNRKQTLKKSVLPLINIFFFSNQLFAQTTFFVEIPCQLFCQPEYIAFDTHLSSLSQYFSVLEFMQLNRLECVLWPAPSKHVSPLTMGTHTWPIIIRLFFSPPKSVHIILIQFLIMYLILGR